MEADVNINEMITIARIARPQGIRGAVIADLLTDFPDRFADIENVMVVRGETVIGELELEDYRFHNERIVLKFVGYDDVNKAEELRDTKLVIERDELVELPTDEYFVFDLVGCDVTTIDGQPLGKVIRVDDFGAAPLLTVRDEKKEILIPLTKEFCPDVDIAGKKIIVNPPAGLLDL